MYKRETQNLIGFIKRLLASGKPPHHLEVLADHKL